LLLLKSRLCLENFSLIILPDFDSTQPDKTILYHCVTAPPLSAGAAFLIITSLQGGTTKQSVSTIKDTVCMNQYWYNYSQTASFLAVTDGYSAGFHFSPFNYRCESICFKYLLSLYNYILIILCPIMDCVMLN